jgi:ABC-type polysaccharide/polyol phosphate transport system ATPase subunit
MTASKKNEPIIEVKHLSKQYNIGVDRTYKTLSDSLTCAVKNPLKTLKESLKSNKTFWALKDVNFKIERGEVVGIIGRNGAGKSTLLKILSRITFPTEGEVRMRGRVGSLLEVGTGFHPELTGRENVYFNGAILGMKKREIDERFDEIVKFSGVEKFLDTPVKRYSSGMQVRLAFSVAAHLDPEILIIDEVLTVGDAAFQKKCLGKMDEIAESGQTVLFVSHNMGAVQNLCMRCILIESGITKMIGDTKDVVQAYIDDSERNGVIPLSKRMDRSGNHKVKITGLMIDNDEGNNLIKSFDRLRIKVKFEDKIKNYHTFHLLIGCYDINSTPLFRIDTKEISTECLQSNQLEIHTGGINLNSIICSFNIALLIDGEISDYIVDAMRLNILENSRDNVEKFPPELATILIETEYKY